MVQNMEVKVSNLTEEVSESVSKMRPLIVHLFTCLVLLSSTAIARLMFSLTQSRAHRWYMEHRALQNQLINKTRNLS